MLAFGKLSGQGGHVKVGRHLYGCLHVSILLCKNEWGVWKLRVFTQYKAINMYKQETLKSQSRVILLKKIFCDGMISSEPFSNRYFTLVLWKRTAFLQFSEESCLSELVLTIFIGHDQLKLCHYITSWFFSFCAF